MPAQGLEIAPALPHCPPFNSLFEMLSTRPRAPRYQYIPSFNSLFEMLFGPLAHRQGGFRGLSSAFNSLFEMRWGPAAWPGLALVSFNSLFEMLQAPQV